MKRLLLILVLLSYNLVSRAQRIDTIFFSLYTDSLKKGVYNYISVDGKLADGGYLPLTTDEVIFTSSGGKWDHNSIIVDKNFGKDSIVITAKLKSDTAIAKTITIYIKKIETEERLKTKDEILEEVQRGTRRKAGNKFENGRK